MVSRVIAISGPVAAGKSRLARALSGRYQYAHVKTRDIILALRPKLPGGRKGLQAAGDLLDRQTQGQWITTQVVRLAMEQPEVGGIVVDSVRTAQQVEGLRLAFGSRVVHVHLTASEEYLKSRFAMRPSDPSGPGTYDDVRLNRTERDIGRLADVADVVVDTSRSSESDVVVRVASHLGLYARPLERPVDVIVGGQYGSEGKGNIAAYLAPEYGCLVRVGGPNAGHTVYQEPRKYVFHQLPSGTMAAPDSKLVVGPGAVISVHKILQEIADNDITRDRLAIDPQAVVISEADVAFEQEKLVGSIGSTGQGVGKATARRILRGGATEPVVLARDHSDLAPFVGRTVEVLEEQFAKGHRVLLEGTQGSGLSIYHGQYPKVTSRDTTVSGCLAEAGISPSLVRRIIMVIRTYPIRAGTGRRGSSGPMSQEISWKEVARRSGYSASELRRLEVGSTSGKLRRVAEFDWEQLRLSATLNGPTDIALTFVDYLIRTNRDARRFEQLNDEAIRMVAEIERVAAAPVSLITVGPRSRNVIDRRSL